MDFEDQTLEYHLPVEPQCGLSTDVSYDVVKLEPIHQLADYNVYAGALYISYNHSSYNRHFNRRSGGAS